MKKCLYRLCFMFGVSLVLGHLSPLYAKVQFETVYVAEQQDKISSPSNNPKVRMGTSKNIIICSRKISAIQISSTIIVSSILTNNSDTTLILSLCQNDDKKFGVQLHYVKDQFSLLPRLN